MLSTTLPAIALLSELERLLDEAARSPPLSRSAGCFTKPARLSSCNAVELNGAAFVAFVVVVGLAGAVGVIGVVLVLALALELFAAKLGRASAFVEAVLGAELAVARPPASSPCCRLAPVRPTTIAPVRFAATCGCFSSFTS